jgi:heme exporter protein CcmD
MGARSGGLVNNFWAMGGYARYVWPSFALAIAVLFWNVWAAQRYFAAAKQRAMRALAMTSGDEQ